MPERNPADYHKEAVDQYARCDEVIVQEIGGAAAGDLPVVDFVEGGAWVMAWIFVSDGDI